MNSMIEPTNQDYEIRCQTKKCRKYIYLEKMIIPKISVYALLHVFCLFFEG